MLDVIRKKCDSLSIRYLYNVSHIDMGRKIIKFKLVGEKVDLWFPLSDDDVLKDSVKNRCKGMGESVITLRRGKGEYIDTIGTINIEFRKAIIGTTNLQYFIKKDLDIDGSILEEPIIYDKAIKTTISDYVIDNYITNGNYNKVKQEYVILNNGFDNYKYSYTRDNFIKFINDNNYETENIPNEIILCG